MRIIINLIAGLLFGLGLLVSGMANPAKVLNFLDLAGTWDPSLAFVMAGAIAVALPELSQGERMWRLHFTAGAMAHTVTRAPVMRDLFGGVLNINDRQLLIARLVRFAAAGFRAPEGY